MYIKCSAGGQWRLYCQKRKRDLVYATYNFSGTIQELPSKCHVPLPLGKCQLLEAAAAMSP